MNRIVFYMTFLLIVNSVLLLAFSHDVRLQTQDVLMNLGVEILGVFTALYLAEWFLKTGRMR